MEVAIVLARRMSLGKNLNGKVHPWDNSKHLINIYRMDGEIKFALNPGIFSPPINLFKLKVQW